MEFNNIPVSKNGREIGQCIYCGAQDVRLSTEHTIPYAINGPWTLLKASCDVCAKVTQAFERDTIRSLWGSVRNALAMQSRHSKQRSPTLPLVVQRNGLKETIQVPRSEYPTYLTLPLFPTPAITWASSRPAEGVYTNIQMFHIAGPAIRIASERFPGAEFVGVHTNFSPVAFAQTIAKIGFCAAIYALGIGPFTHTPIRNIILGSDRCINRWVGSWHQEPINESDSGLHAVKVLFGFDGNIHVILKLFAQFGAVTEYHVVLGPPDPAFMASNDWPFSNSQSFSPPSSEAL